jgi:hypothetical protein
MSFFLSRKPVLTPAQIERMSNMFDNAGQVFLGVLVLTPIVQGIDKTNILVILSGVLYVLGFWIISLILARLGEIEK